ncbi:MAG: T9SS type A sorting domain-containing protein [bacterium]|nr:MAG: T9SS type A sorting domain-containing protein [bacterium]
MLADRKLGIPTSVDWEEDDDPVTPDAKLIVNIRVFPNPFNPMMTIRFSLAERSHVTLCVYNVAGQLIRTLIDEERARGYYDDVTWDGRNNRGSLVSSGVYLYKLKTEKYSRARKMIFIR